MPWYHYNYISPQDGSRFRVTNLPSVATGQTTVQEDVLDELEAVDAMPFQERETQ